MPRPEEGTKFRQTTMARKWPREQEDREEMTRQKASTSGALCRRARSKPSSQSVLSTRRTHTRAGSTLPPPPEVDSSIVGAFRPGSRRLKKERLKEKGSKGGEKEAKESKDGLSESGTSSRLVLFSCGVACARILMSFRPGWVRLVCTIHIGVYCNGAASATTPTIRG